MHAITRKTTYLLVTVLSVFASSACAAEPGAVVDYDTRWQRDRERDVHSHPAEILEFSNVQPGMKVLDIFSGGGYWSELFARAVGDTGKVVAHTNTAFRNFSGELADARFKDGRVPNVEILNSELNDLGFGHERFDVVLLSLGYHDLYFHAGFWPQPGRDRFLMQVRDALKPTGRLIVIDHAAAAGTGATHAQTLHRVEPAYARRDIERHGFTFEAETTALRNADDDHTKSVFDDGIRGRTDRFGYRFRRQDAPASE